MLLPDEVQPRMMDRGSKKHSSALFAKVVNISVKQRVYLADSWVRWWKGTAVDMHP